MPDRPEFYFPDLVIYPPVETLRRRLYDAAVMLAFPRSSDNLEEHLPSYGPDDCNFTVIWLLGRWFAYWRDLEAGEDQPLCHQLQLVRIHMDHDRPEGIHFSEC